MNNRVKIHTLTQFILPVDQKINRRFTITVDKGRISSNNGHDPLFHYNNSIIFPFQVLLNYRHGPPHFCPEHGQQQLFIAGERKVTATGKSADIWFNHKGKTMSSGKPDGFKWAKKSFPFRMGDIVRCKYSASLQFRTAAFTNIKTVITAAATKKMSVNPFINQAVNS